LSITFRIDGSVLDFKKEVIMEVGGSTVGAGIDYLVQQQASLVKALFDEKGNLEPFNYIKINGNYVTSNVLTMPIKDGDRIEIIKFRGC